MVFFSSSSLPPIHLYSRVDKNPFELLQGRRIIKDKLERNVKSSRFIDGTKLNLDYLSKRRRKLQLFNLNDDNISLTHNNQPLDDHLESDPNISDEDDEFDGDFTNFPKKYENYKLKQELTRKNKADQLQLLKKLNSQFTTLDFTRYFKEKYIDEDCSSSINIISDGKEKYIDESHSSRDKEGYIKESQPSSINIIINKDDNEWLHHFNKCNDINEIILILENFIKDNGKCIINININELLNIYINKYKFIINKILIELPIKFNKFINLFTNCLLIICKYNLNNCKNYFYNLIINNNFINFNINNIIIILLLLKIININTNIYKICTILLEIWLKLMNFNNNILSLLLIITCYNLILETSYFIPLFYQYTIQFCINNNNNNNLINHILNLIIITLKLLKYNNSYIHPILIDVISPKLYLLHSNNFKKFIHDELNQIIKPYHINLYLQKVCLKTYKHPLDVQSLPSPFPLGVVPPLFISPSSSHRSLPGIPLEVQY